MFGSSEWYVMTGATILALAIDPQDPAIVYAAGSMEVFWNLGDISRGTYVFRSPSGGGYPGYWEAVLENGLYYETSDFSAVAIDPQNPMKVYAGSLGLGTPRA